MTDELKFYTLADAQHRAMMAPSTFERPDDKSLGAIAPGDFVKLCFEPPLEEMIGERMWVKVTEVGDEQLTGKLSNNPFYLYFQAVLELGDLVVFERRHIFALYPKEKSCPPS